MWGRRATLHLNWSKWGMRRFKLGQTRICAHCIALLQCISSIFFTFKTFLNRNFKSVQVLWFENQVVELGSWWIVNTCASLLHLRKKQKNKTKIFVFSTSKTCSMVIFFFKRFHVHFDFARSPQPPTSVIWKSTVLHFKVSPHPPPPRAA